MMFKKICSKCGKTYPANTQCECRKDRHKVYDKYNRNKASAAVYHDKRWQRLTQMCKARCNGINMYKLMTTGRIVIPHSGLSHHIVEVVEDKAKAYDIDNLIYVGSDSHAEIHRIYNSGEDKKRKLQKQMINFIKNYVEGGGG